MITNYVLMPGAIAPPENILVGTNIDSNRASHFAAALRDGIRAQGYTAAVYTTTPFSFANNADHSGDPRNWPMTEDVRIVDMGQYVGRRNFLKGDAPDLEYARTLFLTPAAEPLVSSAVYFDFETGLHDHVHDALEEHLPKPVHLIRPSILQAPDSVVRMNDMLPELMRHVIKGDAIPSDLADEYEYAYNKAYMDRIMSLRIPLW